METSPICSGLDSRSELLFKSKSDSANDLDFLELGFGEVSETAALRILVKEGLFFLTGSFTLLLELLLGGMAEIIVQSKEG